MAFWPYAEGVAAMRFPRFGWVALVASLAPAAAAEPASKSVRLTFDAQRAPVAHGAARLKAALEAAGWTVDDGAGAALVRIESARDGAAGDAESFRILHEPAGALVVRGGGPSGAMYGALAVAEDLRNGVALNDIPERDEKARFPFRAIKFNLPWMSYRRGESLQLHQETCRDLKFWEAFLDQMAANRFNVLSLWGLHPFTLMIRPKSFPEACGLNDQELADWQRFWKALFRMAKDRGI
jgi:hypothetical protein